MFRRPIFWIVAVLLCVVGAWCLWQRGSRPNARPLVQTAASASKPSTPPALAATNAPATNSTASLKERLQRARLSNTTEPLNALLRRDSALVLENARWDTTKPLELNIPAHLRAQGDPGTYIVKAAGRADESFQEQLRAAGLLLVSYLPHDAWLVRGSQVQVSGLSGVAAVIPFEPYFKLKSSLLLLAVEQQPIPAGTYLNILLFGDDRTNTERDLAGLGVTVVGEGPSPFGPVLTVQARPNSLTALAQVRGVQIIERSAKRATVNDLTRVTMGISTDTLTTNNYFGLTGSNVVVAVTDSGIDATHPDLTGRVLVDPNNPFNTGQDTIGHGTHVAGIIAASGISSGTVPLPTNGSIVGANFRGKAPASKLFSLRLGDEPIADLRFDAYAQEQIATNALISNNSWGESGVYDYNLTAASYDAAVRDARPLEQGSQPVLFVFSAGNDGGGADNGLDGVAGSVISPATAKNVITVGSLEQLRNITNDVQYVLVDEGGNATYITNQPWAGETDSGSEVAPYSSRGNVGPGVEGEFGRFKPDVVAPGTFTISTRSHQWDEGAYYSTTNKTSSTLQDQIVQPGKLNQYSVFVPSVGIGLQISVVSTDPVGITNLPIYVRIDDSPTTNDTPAGFGVVTMPPGPPDFVAGSGYFFAVGNPNASNITFNVTAEITYTNNLEDYYRVLKQLNNALGGEYRFETGSSMAAPAVSGFLALMQEFYAQRMNRTNSPALMKALLINGARSASAIYSLQVQNTVNHQGWGLPNLPTSLPPTTNGVITNNTSFTFYDQNPTNALATGQSQTRQLTLNNAAQNRPLRVTLVWTDPPGNPAAGVKLVNDLDLVVTNLDTGAVYLGNNIPANSDFTASSDTNAPPSADLINNVENVYIGQALGTNFTVTVIGHRVNVNAVTAHTNETVQDYALVISSGNGEVIDSFTVAESPVASLYAPNVTAFTNAATAPLPLLNQTVGANSPITSGVNGITNQWHFYVLTNDPGSNPNAANFTNAAFITFSPPSLATPRMGTQATVEDEHSRSEADIDMYVSLNPELTNLNATLLADTNNTWRSVGRGGTETVVIASNIVAPNVVFYVGIKSEDQMAAEYGFLGIFSDEPFSTKDENGNLFLRGFPVPAPIPDGTPSQPGTALVFGIATEPIKVRRVIVTNIISHENFGDLFNNLSHNNSFSVLHNHSFGDGNFQQTFVYDDSDQGDIPDTKKSDGPGSLQNFVGQEGVGQWMLTMLDDAPGATGSVERLTIKIEPQDVEGDGDLLTIGAGRWGYTYIDVPPGATNLMVGLSGNTLPVDLYVRRGDFPDFVNYDKMTTVQPYTLPDPRSTNALSITKADLPPLQPGTYYIGVFNPNAIAQTVLIKARVEIDLDGIVPEVYTNNIAIPILDDAVTYDQIFVTNKHKVITAEVGVRINHPRVSDLALQLQSPTGRRVMLFENRGGNDVNGLGSDIFATNSFNFSSSGGPGETNFVINTGATEGTIRINYEFFGVPDTITVYYESAVLYSNLLANAGYLDIHYGPGASQDVTIFMNQGGNTNLGTLWEFSVTTRPIGYRDLIFTEYTNKVSEPDDLLKFVLPPFTSGAAGATLLASGFEMAVAGSYANPSVIDGWTVTDTNEVGVVADAVNAYVGNQFLALADGHITRSIPTLPGRDYLLQYAYRGPGIAGWWRGEGNGLDQIGGNTATTNNGADFGPGEVGQAFTFDGVDDSVSIPASPALDVGLGAGFTIDLWSNPTKNTIAPMVEWNDGTGINGIGVHLWQGVDTGVPGNGLGNYLASVVDTTGVDHHIHTGPGLVFTNVYQHVALTYNKASGVAVIYLNGVAVQTTNLGVFTPKTSANLYFGNRASGPFSTDHYQGRLDEVSIYNRAASAAEMKAIFLRGVNGKFDTNAPPPLNLAKASVTAGAYTNVFFGDVAWLTQSTVVRAASNALSIDFQGFAPGMLLDEIKVTEQPTNLFVLPEEPLTALKGDKAFGNWKLEMWDSRVGASNPVPELLEWNLSFIFEQEVPPFFVLQPFVPFTNSIAPGSFHYLIVDVPAWANVASNYLLYADLPLFVWFNQNGAPTGSPADTALIVPAPTTNGVGVIITNGAPPLLPGVRYYIGLQNTNATAVNYGFQVDFDITALTNGVPYTNAVPSSNSIPRYFSYDVSAAATAVQFDLFNLTGDMHLIARQGAPLPALYGTGFDYGSFNVGLNDEQILVFTNSTPVALKPGVWYLGVINATALPANYTIMATEFTNAFPDIITLTNAIPYANSNLAAAGTAQYYRYVVTTNAARVQFETFGAEGDFTLVASKGLPLPDLGAFDYSSANPGTNDEVIVITTNSAPVTLTFGDWFITAVKISGGAANYSIMATEANVTGHPIIITDFNVSGGDFCFTWNSVPGAHYIVQSTPILNPTAWTNASPTITAVDFTTTWCTPITGTMSYFQVVEGIGAAAIPAASVNISSVQYTPGGIVLTWLASSGSTFHVEWTDSLAAPVIWNHVATPVASGTGTFTFTDDGSLTAPLGPVRFYRLVQP